MRGIDADAPAQGFHDAALLVSPVADLLQALENQRVMRDDQLTAELICFLYDSFRDVQADKNLLHIGGLKTYLKSAVVVVFLEGQRSKRFQLCKNF